MVVLVMTLIFCGIGSDSMLRSAVLPPGHVEFAMSEPSLRDALPVC
jgi:hypothetical protein